MRSLFGLLFLLPAYIYRNRGRHDMREVVTTTHVGEYLVWHTLIWSTVGCSLAFMENYPLSMAGKILFLATIANAFVMGGFIARGLLEYIRKRPA